MQVLPCALLQVMSSLARKCPASPSAMGKRNLNFSAMRRLLIAVLFLVAGSAHAGNLGRADIESRNNLPVVSEFYAQCVGPLDESGWWGRPECKVKFVDARMIVDDSMGIKASQVIGLSFHFFDMRGKKYIEVLYKDDGGKVSLAQFGFRREATAKQFINTLLNFMGKHENP